MRLNRQYIRTQLMAQNITKKVSADKGRSTSAEVLEKAYSRLETRPSEKGIDQLNYSKTSVAGNNGTFSKVFQSANDRTVTDTGEETVIRSNNPYESESDIRIKILDEKYSRMNAINKTKSDPLGYIKDKYQNSKSPYFRSDLSAAERQAAYDNETEWLFKGKAQNYNLQDAAFRNLTFNGEAESENAKVFQRSQVNQQLQMLLNRNHIQIPAGTELTFTITPIDYKVKVSGTDDKELIGQIERLLQSGDNSKELFLHILKSQTSDSAQYSEAAYQKYQAVREMYEVTGYHLKDLEVVDGRYITPDGRDLLEVYKEKLENDPMQKQTASYAISHYGSQLSNIAEIGYDAIPDFILSIGYRNGSLRDLGQSKGYGTGDTEWLETLKRQTGVNY
ncbi:DUF4885 domain-containing protein [Bacillus halotolerans]|uniref:DUF4885 domain-containing protein n=1 Tax=Bacillus halotolerans TaxID=260554 RepID=UPI000D03F560|nr:DUF4885 domain-containing protein [Bacillus halotolerans]MBV7320001.1 DUF4885 domain-containing protein [Halalkalibacterium halodurans]PRS02206.1 DUF4885 domain-containing protein [Bacillus halotolerans]PRS18210.1 DUF4885 domain-containing protein [Bacillus halotolerans]QKS03027.1 DUF4885 domain-containing protein [Bacillus halotolerans]QNS20577.1 DUF4885 domain-containing protein [Bacillus halotolerans]